MKRAQLARLLQEERPTASIPTRIIEQAEAAGMVIVYGTGDDRVEFRGAITSTAHCMDGGEVYFDGKGALPDYDDIDAADEAEARTFFDRKRLAAQLRADWRICPPYDWTFITAIPHSTFDMWDDDVPTCKGMVFSLAEAGLHIEAE
jgi:hypothetical protein